MCFSFFLFSCVCSGNRSVYSVLQAPLLYICLTLKKKEGVFFLTRNGDFFFLNIYFKDIFFIELLLHKNLVQKQLHPFQKMIVVGMLGRGFEHNWNPFIYDPWSPN